MTYIRNVKTRIPFFVILFMGFLLFPLFVYAQTSKSNCVVTKIGNTGDKVPILPPECQKPKDNSGPFDGVKPPEGLECRPDGYCKLPDPTDGSYEKYSCANRYWGSKELVSVLYSVAKRWKQAHPQGYLYIGDLNASGHASHKWGRAVDILATTDGKDYVADWSLAHGPYNRAGTIEFGKMLADTDMVQNIWFNDGTANEAVLAYANDPAGKNRSAGMVMQPISGHDDHFHLDIKLDPFLAVYTPGC